VQISGDELGGQISAAAVVIDGCSLSMMSGIDQNWVGQWGCDNQATHNFIATVTRVPPGVASR
jgi:hypothetical protein